MLFSPPARLPCPVYQLLRKRHIGNDIVTIIFQEPGALPFTPKNIRSHFQHVFIIVRAHNPCTDNVCYRYAPPQGPPGDHRNRPQAESEAGSRPGPDCPPSPPFVLGGGAVNTHSPTFRESGSQPEGGLSPQV